MTNVLTSDAWIPLSDPDRLAEVTNGAVSQDLNLPVGADEDRVFLNGPRLVRLAHIAGSKSINLAFGDDDRRPDYSDVVHMGGGVAAAKGLRKVPEHFGDFEYIEYQGFSKESVHSRAAYRSLGLVLALNKGAVAHRIASNPDNQRGQLDERRWARELDRSIKRTAIDASMFRFGFSPLVEASVLTALDSAMLYIYKNFLIDPIMQPESIAEQLVSVGTTVAFLNTVKNIVALIRSQNHNYTLRPNYAIFATAKIDRFPYAAVRIRTLGSVVRYAE